MDILKSITKVLSAEGASNPFLLAILSQLSTLGSFAIGQQGPKAQHYAKIASRTLLDFEEPLRKSVLASPSAFDDTILNEAIEIAQSLVPGYVAEVWPQE